MSEIDNPEHCEESVENIGKSVNSKDVCFVCEESKTIDCMSHLKSLLPVDTTEINLDESDPKKKIVNEDYLQWLADYVNSSQETLISPRPPVFVPEDVYKEIPHLLEKENFVSKLSKKRNYVIPVNFDTEFQTQNISDVFNYSLKSQAREIVTCQISDVLNHYPVLFVHPDLVRYALKEKDSAHIAHVIFREECIIVDYLRHLGYDVSLTDEGYQENDTATPVLTVSLYGFFLVVDLLPFFQRSLLKTVLSYISQEKIKHDRRLRVDQEKEIKGNKELFKSSLKKASIRLPTYITIDGRKFSLSLNLVDVVGAQGKVKLETFNENVDLKMPFKGLMGDDIARMKEAYLKDSFRFTAYGTGDLSVYAALKAHHKNLTQMVADMSSPAYARIQFGLTIGSIMNKILDCKRLQRLQLPLECLFDQRLKPYYDSCLGKHFFDTLNKEEHPAHAQLKVEGGRCRNNRPVLARFEGVVCDLDIKGAYSGGMMDTPYFYGSPTLITYKQPFDPTLVKSLSGIFRKKPVSLKKVLSEYQNRLKPKHWTMRISTAEDLNHPQDFIASWDDYKFENIKNDTESYHETGELDYDSGWTKILSRQIINCMLTSDLLDIILHYWSPSARDEFLKKIHVDSLMFYDPALEIKDENKYVEYVRICVNNEETPKMWFSVPLKDEGVEFMQNKRNEYIKPHPLNTLYKLGINTIYGVTVSKYFPAMNPITANNITACVRAMVYLSEKKFGFCQTITDGGAFDLNAVYTPKRNGIIRLDKLFENYKFTDQALNQKLDMKRCGLGNHKWKLILCDEKSMILEQDGVPHVVVDEEHQQEGDNLIKKEVNRLCFESLKDCFPKMRLFNNPHVAFEMKNFHPKTTLHGSSNYGFWSGNKAKKIKMRGYENKRHIAFTLNEQGFLISADDYTEDCPPAHWMQQQIERNPDSVMLPLPFIKKEILKTARFVKMKHPIVIMPGDNLIKTGKPCYFSESQFTFQTKAQRKHWIKFKDRLKRKYGNSYEIFFLNKDSTLNYQAMLKDIDHLISEGVGCHSQEEIRKHFDPHNNISRIFKKHPRLVIIKSAQDAMKKRLIDFYRIDAKTFDETIAIDEDVEFDEDIEVDENDLLFR